MRILAVGAHPDDIEYGCGGTLLLAQGGDNDVFMLIATDGAAGGDPVVRRQEQEQAAAMVGARGLFWGGFADTYLCHSRELIRAVESVVREVRPDLVLVNHPNDSHQDHQALAMSTTSACRYVQNVLYYHDYTTINFTSRNFVCVDSVLERKCQLLCCHRSQVAKEQPFRMDLLESVRALANYYGYLGAMKYAEAFDPLRLSCNFLTRPNQ
jgi:LmbE family N-acetylglucosaminyl deacetylase